MFGNAIEELQRTVHALELYGLHFGTSTTEFAAKRDEILELARVRAKRMERENYGAGRALQGFLDTVEEILGPNPPVPK